MSDKDKRPISNYDNEWLIVYIFLIVIFGFIAKNS